MIGFLVPKEYAFANIAELKKNKSLSPSAHIGNIFNKKNTKMCPIAIPYI